MMTGSMDLLLGEMIAHNAGDPKRIQHLVKVHAFARYIARKEGLAGEELETLEVAAYVHDIGIRLAEDRYGYSSGKLQEELGAKGITVAKVGEAEVMAEDTVSRAAWLVGHHHTYNHIQGLDYRILVEADFLVNLLEDGTGRDGIQTAWEQIFRTRTGRELCRVMFGLG